MGRKYKKLSPSVQEALQEVPTHSSTVYALVKRAQACMAEANQALAENKLVALAFPEMFVRVDITGEFQILPKTAPGRMRDEVRVSPPVHQVKIPKSDR